MNWSISGPQQRLRNTALSPYTIERAYRPPWELGKVTIASVSHEGEFIIQCYMSSPDSSWHHRTNELEEERNTWIPMIVFHFRKHILTHLDFSRRNIQFYGCNSMLMKYSTVTYWLIFDEHLGLAAEQTDINYKHHHNWKTSRNLQVTELQVGRVKSCCWKWSFSVATALNQLKGNERSRKAKRN